MRGRTVVGSIGGGNSLVIAATEFSDPTRWMRQIGRYRRGSHDCSPTDDSDTSSSSQQRCWLAQGVVATRWTFPHGRSGRPCLAGGTTALVLRLAKENPQWANRRIHGELAAMTIVIAPSSVSAILKRHGIEQSPRRSGPTSAEFLAAQAQGLMACDFSHVHTVLLRRLYVLMFIHHQTRRVRIAGVTAKPAANWVTQQAPSASMDLADQVNPVKFLVPDRHSKFTASFDAVFAAEGSRVIKIPIRAPRANAICEPSLAPSDACAWTACKFSAAATSSPLSPTTSCHYNSHRPHHSLDHHAPSALHSPSPAPIDDIEPANVRRADRLGGLIYEYRILA